jgi:hypothetical protein
MTLTDLNFLLRFDRGHWLEGDQHKHHSPHPSERSEAVTQWEAFMDDFQQSLEKFSSYRDGWVASAAISRW